ncbi:phage head completion protein [Winogradskya humida]|uniref:Head-tail adaptor n=1 Tax=Winogradskya humida TaxID=113566 RepID=A0ABQ4A782_9ACTN|nr:head-tail adaptor protein [Actinoplanes humidus]GIE26691.1 hypothetical protein Ahu01nite_097930 [Actinoplanes humidus]
MILRDRVTRLRAPLVGDGYGNQERDWDQAVAVEYPAGVGPASSTEDVHDQQRTTTRWRVFLPPTADLEATDRVTWDGTTFEVDGDVERWKRRGRLHHVEAVLLKVTQG